MCILMTSRKLENCNEVTGNVLKLSVTIGTANTA